MTAKHGLKFETFVDQFPRKLEKALPGFRIIRSQGDELEYEYEGFDNALDLKIVYDKFQQTRADIGALVGRYADYVRQFALQSRQPQPVQVAVQHYDGYSEKEADWFQKAAQDQRAKLKSFAPPPPPPPVSAPSNKHPNVIKVKPRRPLPPFRPAVVAAPVPPPAPVSKSPARKAPKAVKKSATKAKSKAAKPAKSRPAAAKRAVKAAPARAKAASTARHAAKKAAKPRFMDRMKKLFGRR